MIWKKKILDGRIFIEKWDYDEGIKKASNDIALRLKNSGIDYNTIKKATGINLGVK